MVVLHAVTGVIGGTISSNAWSVSIPDFLLAANLSNHSHTEYVGLATSTSHNAGDHIVISDNSSGLTLGIPAFITTAASVSHTHGIFAGTNITMVSSGSTGLALSVASKLGTATSSNTVSGSTFYMAGNSSGLTLSMPKFITTAPSFGSLILSDANNIVFGEAIAGSTTTVTASAVVSDLAGISHTHGNFTTLSTAGTDILYSSSSNGFTLGVPKYVTSQSWDASVYSFDGFQSSSANISGIPYGLSLTASPGNLLSISSNSTSSGASGYALISSGTAMLIGSDNITIIQDGNRLAFIGAASGSDAGIAFSMSTSNTSGAASLIAAGTLYMQGGNNITLSQTSNSINIVGAPVGIVGISNSETMYTSGSVILRESTNITILSSLDGTKQYFDFSVADPAVAANSVYSVAGGFVSLNIGGVSTTVSVTGLQPSADMTAYVATSLTSVTSLVNSNGIAWGSSTNGSTVEVTGSVNTSYLDASELHIREVSLSGNNTAGVMTDITSGTLYLAGGNNITLSQNANSITISGPNIVGVQTGISGIADSATTRTVGTVHFVDAGGVSFGLNSDSMTASWPSGDYIGTGYLGYWQATADNSLSAGVSHIHGTIYYF